MRDLKESGKKQGESQTFRYSAINTAYSCYKKYKLIYIDKLGKETTSADVLFGTGVHAAINAYFNNENAEEVFSMFWCSLQKEQLKYTRFSYESLKDMGLKFISRWVRLHAKKYELFKTEETITTELFGFNFQGTPDFIGTYEGKPAIVDFKTSSKEYDKKKILTSEQMYLYAYMASKVYGYTVQQLCYVVFIKGAEPRIQTNIKVDVDPVLVMKVLENLKLVCNDLVNRTEFPMNRNNCGYCEFWEDCYGKNN